jgi:dipeptidyl aminopeptidase/acylaminoacyl peptidase
VKAPVLIVHGSADDVVPVEHAYRIAGAATSADLMVVQDAPHQLRLHTGVVELTLEWLERRVL